MRSDAATPIFDTQSWGIHPDTETPDPYLAKEIAANLVSQPKMFSDPKAVLTDLFQGKRAAVVDTFDVDQMAFNPDYIYEWVRSRLADVDGQIQDLTGEVKDKKARSEQLRAFENTVRSLVGVGSSDGSYDATSGSGNQTDLNAKAKIALEEGKKAVADNPALVAKLNALETQIFRTDQFGSKISGAWLQSELDYAKDQLTSLNSDSELVMMRLNMLTQLRSQSISTGSNIQASINDTMKTVIGNMRA